MQRDCHFSGGAPQDGWQKRKGCDGWWNKLCQCRGHSSYAATTDDRRTRGTRSPPMQCWSLNQECVCMEETLPVNIAEGGGRTGLHAAGVSDTDAASPRFEHFTGKVFSIHSSPGATMQGLCALRGYTVFAVKRMDECLPDSSHKAYGREKLVTTRTRGRRTHPVACTRVGGSCGKATWTMMHHWKTT